MVQVNNTPITLRVKFYKKGNLQYISHLDLVRTMMKVIVRAKLPLWYTEGFNPKPKLTFAAPLSIGTESLCEFMDIRLYEKISPDEALTRLNANMTGEMQAVEAYYPENKLTTLKWLAYEITVDTLDADENLVSFINDTLSARELPILKKTKSGEAVVNIKPLIRSAEAKLVGDKITVSCVLSADSSAFLNPEYVIKVLRDKCGILSSENLLEEGYSIIRTNAYREDMTLFR